MRRHRRGRGTTCPGSGCNVSAEAKHPGDNRLRPKLSPGLGSRRCCAWEESTDARIHAGTATGMAQREVPRRRGMLSGTNRENKRRRGAWYIGWVDSGGEKNGECAKVLWPNAPTEVIWLGGDGPPERRPPNPMTRLKISQGGTARIPHMTRGVSTATGAKLEKPPDTPTGVVVVSDISRLTAGAPAAIAWARRPGGGVRDKGESHRSVRQRILGRPNAPAADLGEEKKGAGAPAKDSRQATEGFHKAAPARDARTSE